MAIRPEDLLQPQPPANLGPVKFDLLNEPAFGIPVIGHALNLPNELLAYGVSNIPMLTPPGSEADVLARTEGALASWNKRTDIPWYVKLPAEIGAGLVTPGFGEIGPLKGLTKAATQPMRGALGAAGDWLRSGDFFKLLYPAAARDTDVLARLQKWNPFALSGWGAAAQAKEEVKVVTDELRKRGISPRKFYDDVSQFYKGPGEGGGIDLAEYRRRTGLGELWSGRAKGARQLTNTQWEEAVKKYEDAVEKLDQNAPDVVAQLQKLQQDAYDEMADTAFDAMLRKHKVVRSNGPLGDAWRSLNNEMRGVMMSSGTTWIPNLADIFVKAKIAGVRGQDLIADALLRRENPTAIAPELRKFLGERDPNPALQQVASDIIYGLGDDGKGQAGRSFLHRLSLPQISALFSILGAPAGPGGMALTAGLGAAAKLGHEANYAIQPFLESVARERFFIEGVKKYFAKAAEIGEIAPTRFRDALDDTLKAAIGDDPARALLERFKAEGHLVSPENARTLAAEVGADPETVYNIWRDVYEEATEAGVNFSNKYHFPYTRDINLIRSLRALTPFPVWPIHNLAFYGDQALKHPWLGSTVAGYGGLSHEANAEGDLPPRFLQKVPTLGVPGGTVWANPLAPLSITAQLTEPPQAGHDYNTTSIDRLNQIVGTIGLGLSPTLNMPLQSVGLVDQQQDIQDLFPATRIIRPIGQALGLNNFQPEALLKAPFEFIRNKLAPGTVPGVPYPEYQVRKKLAETAFLETGRPWFESEAYQAAMIDPESDLYRRALHDVGVENTLMYGLRRLSPFTPALLTDAEKSIRDQRAQAEASGLNPKLQAEEFPAVNAYKNLSTPSQQLRLSILDKSQASLSGPARDIFLKEHPDLAMYEAWKEQRKANGFSYGVSTYLNQLQAA